MDSKMDSASQKGWESLFYSMKFENIILVFVSLKMNLSKEDGFTNHYLNLEIE